MKYSLKKTYNPMERFEKWDEKTQKIISSRIHEETGKAPEYQFLSAREGEILELLINILIPQVEGSESVRISEVIDRDLDHGVKGVRYGSDPWPPEFYRLGLRKIAEFSRAEFGKPIEDFSGTQLDSLVKKIFDLAPDDIVRRFLKKVLSDSTSIYFSHPGSWQQIGFPGPAYPEGYPFLDCGEKEKWEPSYEKL